MIVLFHIIGQREEGFEGGVGLIDLRLRDAVMTNAGKPPFAVGRTECVNEGLAVFQRRWMGEAADIEGRDVRRHVRTFYSLAVIHAQGEIPDLACRKPDRIGQLGKCGFDQRGVIGFHRHPHHRFGARRAQECAPPTFDRLLRLHQRSVDAFGLGRFTTSIKTYIDGLSKPRPAQYRAAARLPTLAVR